MGSFRRNSASSISLFQSSIRPLTVRGRSVHRVELVLRTPTSKNVLTKHRNKRKNLNSTPSQKFISRNEVKGNRKDGMLVKMARLRGNEKKAKKLLWNERESTNTSHPLSDPADAFALRELTAIEITKQSV